MARVTVGASATMAKVAHPAQQAPGDAGGAARALGDFVGAFRRHAEPEHPRAPAHDEFEFVDVVELQPDRDAEAVAQRGGQQAGAGGGTDSVNFGSSIFTERAAGPSPMMRSSW